jgi:microcystin degradation protein MlrC
MPVDIVLFGLHGAMVARGYDDCEGDLLARARAIAGPDAIVGAELDMHCHLTDQMVEAANAITAFKEFPHTDFLERAEDLRGALPARRAPRGRSRSAPCSIAAPLPSFMTSREPGRSFVDRIKALEGHDGILSDLGRARLSGRRCL